MNWMKSFSNLISTGTLLSGNCNFLDSTRIEGTIEGENIVVSKRNNSNAILFGDLVVGDKGKCIVRKVCAQNILIDGEITCLELKAHGHLVIGGNAVIKGGELLYEELTIHRGATLNGCKLQAMSLSSKGEEV